MKYTDEELSAFLDGELPGLRMDEIRSALGEDESLADRLADLAQIDALVRSQAEVIDKQPLPETVWRMLKPRGSGRVVSLANWRQARVLDFRPGKQVAMAASVALILGVIAGQWLHRPGDDSGAVIPSVASYLDSIPSGQPVTIDAETELQSRFSFVDQNGRICRQYQLVVAGRISENLACRDSGNWTRVASALSSQIYRAGEFQTASSEQLLASAVQNLMQGSPLSLDEEAHQLGQRQ